MAHFEKALAHNPDHPAAILGLSDILLSIYSQTIPAEPPELSPLHPLSIDSSHLSQLAITPGDSSAPTTVTQDTSAGPTQPSDSAETLNRLAARDRAYQLLSTLTKLGEGWDSSEAWFKLAQAYECCEQVDKAKEALWWVVELEDTRPIRPWKSVGPGGFAL